MLDEELEPFERTGPLPPVGTVTFVPNHLAKAIVGFTAMMVSGIYASVQMGRHQNELLLDELEQRELTVKGKGTE